MAGASPAAELGGFARVLRRAVVAALAGQRREVPDESPYALALIRCQVEDYLGYAIATEEGLHRVAARYEAKGYRSPGEPAGQMDRLRAWLRWANPDDGWRYGDFPDESGVAGDLKRLVRAEAFGPEADDLEAFCVDALAALRADPEWLAAAAGLPRPPIVGVTLGVDPEDFLRTACEANDPEAVRRLRAEFQLGEQLAEKTRRPRSSVDPQP